MAAVICEGNRTIRVEVLEVLSRRIVYPGSAVYTFQLPIALHHFQLHRLLLLVFISTVLFVFIVSQSTSWCVGLSSASAL